MLGNNLALGMALQGTPKDYSTMVVAAKKLGQAAEAKKAAEEEKRRQKIMSDVYKTAKGMPVMPYEQKRVDDMTADFIDELMNAEQTDYGQLASKMMKFEQNMAQMNAEYKEFQKFATNPLGFGLDPKDVVLLQTETDPNRLRENLRTFKFTEDGRLAADPLKDYKPINNVATDFISKNRQSLLSSLREKTQKIGGKEFAYFEIPEETADLFAKSQMSNPITLRDARRDFILNSKELPQEGTPEEANAIYGYLKDEFLKSAEMFLSRENVAARRPATFNFNLGGEKANPIQPNAGNLTKVRIQTKTEENNVYDNVTSFTYRILNATPNKRNINPNDVEIIDTETGRAGGKPKGELGNGAIDLLAVFTRPYTATFTLGGKKETVRFNKGDMAPDFLMTSDMSNYIQMKPYQIGIDINDKTYYIPFGSADELAMVLNEKKSNEGFTSTMMDVVNKSKADLQSQIGQGMDKFYSNFENFLGKSVKPQQGQNTIQQNINEVGKTGKLPSQQKATQKPSTSGTKKLSSETKNLFK
jgi:hypothetical protein